MGPTWTGLRSRKERGGGGSIDLDSLLATEGTVILYFSIGSISLQFFEMKSIKHQINLMWQAQPPIQSLPLNGAGRFTGDVVDDTVDSSDGVADLGGDVPQKIWLERVPVRGHAIGACDSAQRNDV